MVKLDSVNESKPKKKDSIDKLDKNMSLGTPKLAPFSPELKVKRKRSLGTDDLKNRTDQDNGEETLL